LRVGVFYPTLNVYGGGEFVAAVIANTLAKNNYEVILFNNEEVNQLEIKNFLGESLHPSIKVIVNPSLVTPRGLLDLYQTIFRSYTFKSKCDVWIDVYSCRVFPWTNICYMHFPFLNHYSYRPKFPYLKSRYIQPVGGLPWAILEKNLISDNGKLILANSRYTADEIKRFSGKRAMVLYPPVPSIFFEKNYEKLTENQRENLVVIVSRFDPTKELEKIPLIALLTESDIRFAIIGRVHYANTLLLLQKLVKKLDLVDRVQFLPNISKFEMKKILKSAKVYFHTRVGEHFGISIAEAMAMGCIPIVHDSGGAKEFVPECFRYKTIYDAAKKIEKAVYEWSHIKAVEIVKIAEQFREENFATQFMTLFEDYINSSRKGS
jgi:glycosyltransferase involved in cell wall biosynthesis